MCPGFALHLPVNFIVMLKLETIEMENFKVKRNIKAFDRDRYSVWNLDNGL